MEKSEVEPDNFLKTHTHTTPHILKNRNEFAQAVGA